MIGLVIKNTGYLLIGEALRPLLSFLFFAYLARELGVEAVGAYGVILAFSYFFETIGNLGLPHIVTRAVAVDRSTSLQMLRSSTLTGAAISVALWPVAWSLLALLDYNSTIVHCVAVLLLSLPVISFLTFCYAVLEGFGRMRQRSGLTVIENTSRAVGGAAMIYAGAGLSGVVWSIAISRMFVALLAYGKVKSALGTVEEQRPIPAGRPMVLLREAWPILAMTVVSTIYWQVDVIMLSKLSTPIETGLYNSALRYVEILKSLSYTYLVALYPTLSASFGQSAENAQNLMEASIKYIAVVMIPCCAGIALLAPQIVHLTYGRDFGDASRLLQILIWTSAVFPLALVYAKALVAAHHQKADLVANVAGLACNVVLNYLLIGRYGASGAAVATVLSLGFFLLLQRTIATSLIGKVRLRPGLWRPTLAAAVMSPVTLFLVDYGLFAAVAGSAVTYTLVLVCLRTFSAEEFLAMRETGKRVFWGQLRRARADA